MNYRVLASLFVVAFSSGCGDSVNTGGGPAGGGGSGGDGAAGPGPGGGGSGGGTFTEPRGVCDHDVRVGRFTVEKQTDFGVVQGSVADGVVPTAVPEVVSDDGSCQLLLRKNLSCTPACVGAETCGEDGECIPYPRQISVGTVTISGLTKPAVMEPQVPGNTYFAPDAENPPYVDQSEIILSAAGSEDADAFKLFGIGSVPLEQSPTWVLAEGQDLAVTWEAAENSPARIAIELPIDQPGTSPLSLLCEFEDTGSATVPTAVIDQLITSGVSGFPNGRIIRRTADNVAIESGCVELLVGSPRLAMVSVAGFTPCNSPDDCPVGQMCNLAIELCE